MHMIRPSHWKCDQTTTPPTHNRATAAPINHEEIL